MYERKILISWLIAIGSFPVGRGDLKILDVFTLLDSLVNELKSTVLQMRKFR